MSEPLVSVVIPTHRRSWTMLERAVRSVLAQTYPALEIWVVDDSPADFDDRAAIGRELKKLAERDSRLHVIENEHPLGGSLARNRGINAATGEYITFLDDDDEFLPEKIAHQLAFMVEQRCDLSFENMIMYNEKGAVVDVREYPDLTAFDSKSLLEYHLMRHMTGTSTFMFRAEALRTIGGFDDVRMGQEFYLMLKSIESGLRVGYLPICDVHINKHASGSISQGKNKIEGEKALFRFKKKYFPSLSGKARRFIRFRHWAVMVVAYGRCKRYLSALGAGVMAFLSAPLVFFGQVFGFFGRIVRQRKKK